MKKVALCYSGQMRDFKPCFETHKQFLIENNKDCKFYIFGHIWHDSNLIGQPYQDKYPERGYWSHDSILDFLKINPNLFLLEKPLNFNTSLIPDPRFPHPIQNILSMFYSMNKVKELKDSFKNQRDIQFDYVFRLRTDTLFKQEINLLSYDSNFLYVDDKCVHTEYGIGDLFGFGSEIEMDKYLSTYTSIIDLIKKGCVVNPECILGFNLMDKRANIRKLPLENNMFKIFRY